MQRFAVLCPPQIAEQWQGELYQKFHLDAELVLPGTAARLERQCRLGQSIFERYPYTIVSTDFIKSDRHRDDFLRTCPELAVIDEAHTCLGRRRARHPPPAAPAGQGDRSRPRPSLILVTATPHSGNEAAFSFPLTLLDPDFSKLPDDLSGPQNESHRRRLAAHFVQRRRGDIRHYMQADTPFPEREEGEENYKLTADYKRLIEKVLAYARETVSDPSQGIAHRQRVRWWSALALLRSIASSPAAAAATLRTRAATADTDSADEADEVGRGRSWT